MSADAKVQELEARVKELEEELIRYKFTAELATDGIWDWDLVNNTEYRNAHRHYKTQRARRGTPEDEQDDGQCLVGGTPGLLIYLAKAIAHALQVNIAMHEDADGQTTIDITIPV